MIPTPSERGVTQGPEYVGRQERWFIQERPLPQIAWFLYHAMRTKDLPDYSVKTTVNALIAESRKFERSYLVWELVRKMTAKGVVGLVKDEALGDIIYPTGFEGYYVGSGEEPAEIVRRIADYGVELRRYVQRKRDVDFPLFEATMRGENVTANIIPTWILADQVFRSALLHFRSIVPSLHDASANRQYQQFQEANQNALSEVPPIEHDPNILKPEPEYSLKYFLPNTFPIVDLGPQKISLSNIQRQGYAFMDAIGITGTPMHRAILSALSPQTGYIEALTPPQV